MITVAQAREIILAGASPLGSQRLALAQALGRRLAQEVRAQESQPPFASSAMDGYALGGLQSNCLQVGEVAAGQVPDFALRSGECARIFTGAVLPEGTVAVVPQEEARLSPQGCLFEGPLEPGQHMRPAGEHFAAGARLLSQGHLLNSADIGLAALLGCTHLECMPGPTVALLATGDELVELDQPLGPAQVRNSNLYALEAQVVACGGHALRLPIVPDQPDTLRKALLECLDRADVVVTCGGASVGDRDYVQSVLADLGADLQLWKVAMRPGKPLGFARLRGKPVVALPGNPVSCYVAFELFVRPLLDRLQGGPGEGLRAVEGHLAGPVHKKQGLRFFMRCRWQAGRVSLATPRGVQRVDVVSAQNMFDACVSAAAGADVFVATAAVADWRPATAATQKIKKDGSGDTPTLQFTENPDILHAIAQSPRARSGSLYCVGFAAESHDLVANATAKRARKGVPLLVGNIGPSAFGQDDNQLLLVDAQGVQELPRASKLTLARQLVAEIARRIHSPTSA